MPLFKKKLTPEQKKLLETKLMIAEDKPDSYFDISGCGISKIPEGVFSNVMVLRKQALLLQQNLLQDFKGGGTLDQLSNLLLLDISYNKFTHLPKSIGDLKKLQKLDVSHNKLKKLPEEIGNLVHLQVLNVSDNVLSGLPSTIENLTDIQSLDISNNNYLTQLSSGMCYMLKLTDFKFDLQRITYPPQEIASSGIAEIQRWFRKVEEFEFHEDRSKSPEKSPEKKEYNRLSSEDRIFEESIMEREHQQREEGRKTRLLLEQEIRETQEANARILSKTQHDRQQLIQEVEKQDMEDEEAIMKQVQTENLEHDKILHDIYLENDHLDQTIELVLQMSKKSQNTEALLEELEEENYRIEMLAKITTEETQRLRKQEVVEAMNLIMRENEQTQREWKQYEKKRQEEWKNSLEGYDESNAELNEIMLEKDVNQQALIQQLITEEESQKKAFQALQFQKDAKLNRLNKQVEIIQNELARLSFLEIKKREEKKEEEIGSLAEMRIETAKVLAQLFDEQEKREEKLKDMMFRMEEERKDDEKDYWLIQFQRLLDTKPQILVDAENRLDMFVVDTVLQAACREYLPYFARHKVSEAEMLAMTKDKLNQIGVKDCNAQEDILAAIKSAVLMNEQFDKRKEKLSETICEKATPSQTNLKTRLPGETQMGVANLQSECVICLDNAPEIVFLPCGHICSCSGCSSSLMECPICRQRVENKFRVYTM